MVEGVMTCYTGARPEFFVRRVRYRRRQESPTPVASKRFGNTSGLSPSFLVSLAFLTFAATTISMAEAGGIGSGRNVPWWYPSRIWENGERDGAGGWSSYYPSSRGDGEGGWGGRVWGKRTKNGRKDEKNVSGDGVGGWASASRRRSRETAAIAREFVEDCVAEGLGEEEEGRGKEGGVLPVCSEHEGRNETLRRLGESVDRCASPYYSITEIFPSQLVYTEVDPEVEAAREKEEANRQREAAMREASARETGEGEDSDKTGNEEGLVTPAQEDSFLGIFLFLKGDFFSVDLENALTAVAPAYPRAWMVKANAKAFISFSVQYHLYTFPQLLLFKNGRFVSRFRGRRTVQDLAAWLSLQTGELPRALPRRPLPPPPPPDPFSPPGLDEPLAWLALMYAALKMVVFVAWLVRKRGGERVGSGERYAGGVVARARRFARWFMSLLFVRRWAWKVQSRRRGVVIEEEGDGDGRG